MSLRATLWALDQAPVDDPTAVLVLVGLSDEANDAGEGAAPYIDKLSARARVSKRSAQDWVKKLYLAGLITPGDQTIGMRRYGKPAGKAPRTWNLNMTATRENPPALPTAEEIARVYPPQPPKQVESGGVQNLHPTETAEITASDADGVQPTSPHGVQPTARHGVQPASPFPLVPRLGPEEPPPPAPRASSAPPAVAVPVVVESNQDTTPQPSAAAVVTVEEILAPIAPGRRPRGVALDRVRFCVDAAFAAGWAKRDLVQALGDGLVTARSVPGVLTTRLRELGDPPSLPSTRRPACTTPGCDGGWVNVETACPVCLPLIYRNQLAKAGAADLQELLTRTA